MQEQKWEGPDVLTEQATDEDLQKALEDQSNRAVTVHKPGSEFKANGIDYRVTSEGRIESVGKHAKRKRKEKRKAAKQARKKNRRK